MRIHNFNFILPVSEFPINLNFQIFAINEFSVVNIDCKTKQLLMIVLLLPPHLDYHYLLAFTKRCIFDEIENEKCVTNTRRFLARYLPAGGANGRREVNARIQDRLPDVARPAARNVAHLASFRRWEWNWIAKPV